jgi:hypothetical protein
MAGSSQAGSPATGGSPTGGSIQAGSPNTGGAATAGVIQAGTRASGGSPIGGTSQGGSSNTGGATTGGVIPGGTRASGGSATGGAASGGAATGGSTSAGGSANSGGTSVTGGAGGTGTGGTTSGTGGGSAGPVTCGSVTIPSTNDIISDFSNGSLTTPVLSTRGGNTWDTWSSDAGSLPKTAPNTFTVDTTQSGPCNRGGSLHVKSPNASVASGVVGVGIDLKPFVNVATKSKSSFNAKAAGYTGIGFWMKCATDVEYIFFKIPDANNDANMDGTPPCSYSVAVTDPTGCNQNGIKNNAVLKNTWQYEQLFFDDMLPDIALAPRSGSAATFDATQITAFQVQVNVGYNRAGTSTIANPFECWIDDVYFLKDSPPSKSAAATTPPACTSNVSGSAPGGYYVGTGADANKIFDCKTGTQKIFKGVARPSLEWDRAGWNINYPDLTRIKALGANVIRYSLNQSYWTDTVKGAIYQAEIDRIVRWTLALGMDVILDLHWLISGQSTGPDDATSPAFWTSVANKYKGDGRVMFEIYNEPHDISASVWQTSMQKLVDAIRTTAGAKNLILAGGLDWAYNLSMVLPVNALSGTNIAYVTHPYDIKTGGSVNTAAWDAAFGNLAATYPIVSTEFGQTNVNGGPATPTTLKCNGTFYTSMLNYFKSKNIGWTGWSWFVDHYDPNSLGYPAGFDLDTTCGFPQLITSYDGSLNSAGTAVKAAIP